MKTTHMRVSLAFKAKVRAESKRLKKSGADVVDIIDAKATLWDQELKEKE